MQSMLDVFVRDAQDDLRKLSATLPKAVQDPSEVREVQRLGRRVAYNARLAQQKEFAAVGDLIYDAASAALAGTRPWTAQMSTDVGEAVTGLHTLVQVVKSPPIDFEHRVRAIGERLRGRLGLAAPEGPSVPIPAVRPGAAGPAPKAAGAPSGEGLVGLITQLRDAVGRLERDPRDREPLKGVLRKVRPMRDKPDFPKIPAVHTALSAVEEIILSIADQNATVGPAHLALFTRAREALEAALRAVKEDATLGGVERHGGEIERLKAKILETARRARPVIWVTELFFDDPGPHVVSCPKAESAPGGQEAFFRKEVVARLDAAEELRKKMEASGAEQARLAGESLSATLRVLRERAVAFGHRELGRITRRAAAAVRAQLVRPPDQLHQLARSLEEPVSLLRSYASANDASVRDRTLKQADAALEVAILGAAGEAHRELDVVDPDEALQRVLSLRSRIDEQLKRLTQPEAKAVRESLNEMFELLSTYLSSIPSH